MQSLVKGTRSLHHHAGFTRARLQCDTVPDEESPAVRAMSGVEMYKHGLVVRKDDREVCDDGERPMVPKGLSPALRPSVIPPETVIIHVYDISKYRQLNDVLTGFGRLPIAGLFHVGVEVLARSGATSMVEASSANHRLLQRRPCIPSASLSCCLEQN